MKKTLFSQEALLASTVVAYFAAIHLEIDPMFGVLVGTIAASLAMLLFAKSTKFAALARSTAAFTALIAIAAGFAVTADVFSIWLTDASPVKFAMLAIGSTWLLAVYVFLFLVIASSTADHIQRKLYPKSRLALLIAYNMLWPGATVSAAYLGITFAGVGMLAVAIFLPIALSIHES
ncbi:hypothetical protein CL630_02115 [bacterium]|nr:hypothetical protein [bacterium]|tara:strand:+ start:2822 stop:3352 length:531 start_codon:yes stop_codon:yes gene_type:complete